jgi:uncharacterized protein YbjT (DUF2867 family)
MENEKRKAIVFGSTGLIGNLLVEELLNSDLYYNVKVFVRQSLEIEHPKLEVAVVDFLNPDSFSGSISGDDLFICLGTTIKKAGSVKKMEEIDRDLPVFIANAAIKTGVKRIAVVSSIGANPSSSNYYLRIKGEMEQKILKCKFENTAIVRPSMLMGDRKEKRGGEAAGKIVMKFFNPLLHGKMRKYRSIHASDVARAMISLLSRDEVKTVYESDELKIISDRYSADKKI